MSSSTLLKIQAFQRQLHAHALEAARHFTSLNTNEIAAYSRSFHQSVPNQFEPSGEQQLLQSLDSARLLLFGDFHTLKQSQRGFLRLLSEARRRSPAKSFVVALEIFNADDQPHIDAFLRAEMTEAAFLQKIDYFNKWGFPWENYQPIVQYCREQEIPIIGINSQFDSPKRLARRDVYAAEVLNHRMNLFPHEICFCLIGEYHLADEHLLAQIDPKHHVIRVVSNVDELALQTLTQAQTSCAYVLLRPHFYCVLNTVPWVKWQSLAVWEEMHANADQGQHPDDLYTEHHCDFDYQLLHILRALNAFLELQLPNSDLTHFDLYVRPDKSTLPHLKDKLKLDKHAVFLAQESLVRDGMYYLSPARAVIIQDISMMHFSEAAGHILYDALHPRTDGSTSLISKIERQICRTLTSILMDPRQPTLAYEYQDDDQESVYHPTSRDTNRLALKTLRRLITHGENPAFLDQALYADEEMRSCGLFSRHLGEALGTAIFQSLWQLPAENLIPALQSLFKGSLSLQLKSLMPFNRELARSAS